MHIVFIIGIKAPVISISGILQAVLIVVCVDVLQTRRGDEPFKIPSGMSQETQVNPVSPPVFPSLCRERLVVYEPFRTDPHFPDAAHPADAYRLDIATGAYTGSEKLTAMCVPVTHLVVRKPVGRGTQPLGVGGSQLRKLWVYLQEGGFRLQGDELAQSDQV